MGDLDGIRGSGWEPETSSEENLDPRSPQAPVAQAGGGVVGVVRGLHERMESSGFGSSGRTRQVVSFRVERHTEDGTQLPPVPVEMRGGSFDGVLGDGDWVQVGGRHKAGRTHRPHRVMNLTTGTPFTARGGGQRLATIVGIAVAVAALAIIAFIVVNVVQQDTPTIHPVEAPTVNSSD